MAGSEPCICCLTHSSSSCTQKSLVQLLMSRAWLEVGTPSLTQGNNLMVMQAPSIQKWAGTQTKGLLTIKDLGY